MSKSNPTTATATAQSRASLSYTPQWDRFLYQANSPSTTEIYEKQYSHVYSRRLAALRHKCIANLSSSSKNKNKSQVAERIIHIQDSNEWIMAGTIVVDGDVTSNDMYEDAKHTHVLEDDSGRLALNFSKYFACTTTNTNQHRHHRWIVNNLVTGVVCAVRGSVQQNTGILNVIDISFAHNTHLETETAEYRTISNDASSNNNNKKKYAMLVSGVECGNMDAELSIKRDLLVDSITSLVSQSQNIAHVIIAGGSTMYDAMKEFSLDNAAAAVAMKQNTVDKKKIDSWKHRKNLMAENRKQKMLFPMQCLDETFCTPLLSGGVPLTLMSSKSDPTNAHWPQQPLHPSLMPYSSTYNNIFHRGTNPCQIQMNGSVLLGSDGSSVRDILKQIRLKAEKKAKEEKFGKSKEDENAMDVDGSLTLNGSDDDVRRMSEIDALELTLKWGHLSPTAPDTMNCFPLMTTDADASDSLCLDRICEAKKDDSSSSLKENLVYFIGNCDAYDSRLVSVSVGGDNGAETSAKNARLICVPSFSKTSEVVLVDMESPTLECTVLKIDFNV